MINDNNSNDTSGTIIMKIQDKIKTNRKNKGLSQKQLAEMVGINTSHLSRLENGRYQPSIEVLKELADALLAIKKCKSDCF